jgi:hypothetical protein
MFNEITSTFTLLKNAFDIIKSISSIDKDVEVNKKFIELQRIIFTLQNHLISLQSEYLEIQDKNNSLIKELSKVKDWDKIKEKYILKEISPKVIAYVHKDEKEAVSANHWLCVNCFDHQQKESILQIKRKGGPQHLYYCPICKNEILIKNDTYKPIMPKVIRNSNYVTGRTLF